MTLFHNLPLLMVVAFLLLTLIVGLYYSRKVTSLREYATGNKRFTTATLVATLLATSFGGGGLIRTIEQIHITGLYWIMLFLFSTLGIWMISILAVRMGPFMQHLSMAETIGSVYGTYTRVITVLVSLIGSIVVLTSQITVISEAIRMCINIESSNSYVITIIAASTLIAYSAFGGIRAVTFTDVLQFITFTSIVPLLAWYMFTCIREPVATIIPFLQSKPIFQLERLFHSNQKLLALIALILADNMSRIECSRVQRIYMAASPIQARSVFVYSTVFHFIITIFIIITGLFVFISEPDLTPKKIWPYIMDHIPFPFKGCVAISLLAMAMSTADSILNSCSVMISHDIVESLKIIKCPTHLSLRYPVKLGRLLLIKAAPNSLKIAKVTSLTLGLLAMLLAFKGKDLLTLLYLGLDLDVPIITAPFILAIFGFRGSSRTALIGMSTGALAILTWNKWIKNINGSFFCMLANGLAMLAAHYLLPQPEGSGWVAPDKTFQQRQQEKARIARRNSKARAVFFLKENLTKLQPNAVTLVLIGVYIMLSSLVSICYYSDPIKSLWIIFPFFTLGIGYIGYVPFFHGKENNHIPDWIIGKYWFLSLLCCLPLHLLVSCALSKEFLLPLALCFTHGAVLLWTLPLYWSIRGLLITVGTMVFIYWYKGNMLWPSVMVCLPLLGVGLLMLILVIYFKYQSMVQQNRISYFQDQQQLKESYKLKSIAYALDLSIVKSENQLETEAGILEQAIQNVTQSISFSDEYTTFYKEDFQTIIHKFSEWATYLKQRAKSQDHALLQPTAIDIEDFIDAIEVAYEKECGTLPGLWIEKIELAGVIPSTLIGDREQLVTLLVMAIVHITKANTFSRSIVTLQLHTTHLQYKKSEPLEEGAYPSLMVFPALVFLLSHAQADQNAIPEVENIYRDDIEDHTKPHSNANLQMDLKKQKMERIVRAHYGYMALPNPDVILLVIPKDVTQIKEEMLAASLPREAGTSEAASPTPQEQAESLTKLIDFHDWVCSTTMVEPAVISEILLLLRRCYGFKRHACGELFYLRAVGIATWVGRWVGYHPKLIYAALLYDLVRYTRLPLSYIKANYNLGVLCFVENALSIDSRSELEASLLAVSNRFKEALEKEQLSVLYIKLAERLYDLEHAAGYGHAATVKAMAKESLAMDVQLAKRYLNTEIAATLERTASGVLLCV